MQKIINEYLEDIKKNKYKWLLVLGFAFITLIVSWNSDDAYHAYIMAKNLAEGNGFVYNVGYRVTATTCPLFTLVTAFVYMLLGCRHMYFVGIFLGVLFSTLAVYILVFKLCDSIYVAIVTTSILLGCYCFMCYTTAGLENSLLFFLSALFVFNYNNKEVFSIKDLFVLAFLLSLLALTRMDSVLLFIPAICVAFLFFTKVPFLKRVVIGFMGLLPFVAWEIFSIIYYGYPFPNTMYVKLSTGFPETDYYKRGLDFIMRSTLTDIMLLVIPVLFLICSLRLKSKRMILAASGVALYLFYVVSIGGDFMVGRHMTVPFFVSLVGIIIIYREQPIEKQLFFNRILISCLMLELVWGTCVRPIASQYLYIRAWEYVTGVADEKNYYYAYAGFIPYIQSYTKGEQPLKHVSPNIIDWIEEARRTGDSGACFYSLPGIENYFAQEEGTIYLTDAFGLMDPLLSHLPAVWEENWRIGHMKRSVPEGYNESVATGTNQIVNESLHEYYDNVLEIIQGDIWDIHRLKIIIKMNIGRCDYLLDEYNASLLQ